MPNFDLSRAASQEFRRLGLGHFAPIQFIDRPLGELQDFYAVDPNRPAPQFTNEQLGARFQQARTALQTFGDVGGRSQTFNTALQTINSRLQEQGRPTLNIQGINPEELGSLESLFPNLSEAGTGPISLPQERMNILRDIGAAQAAYQSEINRQTQPAVVQPQTSQRPVPTAQQIEEARRAMMRGEMSPEQFSVFQFRARNAQPAAPGIQDVRAQADQPTPRSAQQQASKNPAQQMLAGTIQPNRSVMEAAGLTREDYLKGLDIWRGREGAPATPPGEATGPTQPQTQEYTIRPGDNLTKIAKQYGVTVADILKLNPQITNPNLIFSGNKLNLPGLAIASEIPPSIPVVDQVSSINDLNTSITKSITKGKDMADPLTAESEFEKRYDEAVDVIFGDVKTYDMSSPDGLVTSDGTTVKVDNASAVAQYNSLVANNPRIQGYQDDLLKVQTELATIEAAELAMVNDIRKEVQGEASESYIQALAAKRMQDIYPKKLLLLQKEAIYKNALQSEKENAANIMQYWLHDEETQYNKMWDQLNFLTQRMDRAEDLEQMALSNDMQIINIMKDLPADRSVSIGGVTYTGMASTSDLNVIQVQRPNGEIVLLGIDKNTGQKLYETSAGQGKLPSSGGDDGTSFAKQLKEFEAKTELEALKDPQNQKINAALNSGKVGYSEKFGIYYDKESFLNAQGGAWWNNSVLDHMLDREDVIDKGAELVNQ